jgi:predicted component of type VI protein secretion system
MRQIGDLEHLHETKRAELGRSLEVKLEVSLSPAEYTKEIRMLEAKEAQYKAVGDFENAQRYKVRKVEEVKKEQQKLEVQKAKQIEIELKETDKKFERKIAEMKK